MALQGSGTAQDPILIFNVDDLKAASLMKGNLNFKFMADLDIRGLNEKFTFDKMSLNTYTIDANHKNLRTDIGDIIFNGQSNRALIKNVNLHLYFGSGRIFKRNYPQHGYISMCEMSTFTFHVPITGTIDTGINNLLDGLAINAIEGITGNIATSGFDVAIDLKGPATEGWINLSDFSFVDYPIFNADKFEITKSGLLLTELYSRYFSGHTTVNDNIAPGRVVRAISCVGPKESLLSFETQSDESGKFMLPVGDFNTPFVIFSADKVDDTLKSRVIHQKGSVYVPINQNGYKYNCLIGGETVDLPDQLPISGKFSSGTAQFEVSPLLPSTSYGPLTAAKVLPEAQ